MNSPKKDKGKEKVEEDEIIEVQNDVKSISMTQTEKEFEDEIKLAIELSKRSIENKSIENYHDQGSSSAILQDDIVQPANHARQLEILKLFIHRSQISTAGAELFYQDIRNGKFNSVQSIENIARALFYRYTTLEQFKHQAMDKCLPDEQFIEMIESFKICKNFLISISYRFIKDKIIEDLQKLDDFSYLNDLDLLNSDRIDQYFSQTNDEKDRSIKNVIDKYDGKNSKMNNDLSAIISLIDQIKTNIKNTEYGSGLVIKTIEIFSDNETYLNIDEIAQLIGKTDVYFSQDIDFKQILNAELEQADIKADIEKFVDASVIKFGIFNQSHKLLIQDIYDGKFKSLKLVDFLINTIISANVNKADLNQVLKNSEPSLPQESLKKLLTKKMDLCAQTRIKLLDNNYLEILKKDILGLIGQEEFDRNIIMINHLAKYFDKSYVDSSDDVRDVIEFNKFLNKNDYNLILELTDHYSSKKALTEAKEYQKLIELRKLLLDHNIFFTSDVIKDVLEHNDCPDNSNDRSLYNLDEEVMLKLAVKNSEQELEQKIIRSPPPEQTSEIIVSLTGQELQEQLD